MVVYPADELKRRSRDSALRVIRLSRSLPKTLEAGVINRQLLRSAASVAANYRAVCRARSKAEFVAKIGVVVEEMDETLFWIELLVDASIVPAKRMQALILEAGELLAIFAASQRTAKRGGSGPPQRNNDSMNQFQ